VQFELPFRRVVDVAPGSRAAEREVIERIAVAVEAGRQDHGLLAEPLRVVVPSRSLRAHLSEACVRTLGRALPGLIIQTLHGAALEVLERAGESVRPAGPMEAILVRRNAREEPALRDRLDGLVEGYTAVGRSVSDLLDAGLTPGDAAPLIDALERRHRTLGPGGLARAEALVRVAAGARQDLETLGLDRPSAVLVRATALLSRSAERALPARLLLLHGFVRVPGGAAGLLEALAAHPACQVVLDHPRDPAFPGQDDAGVAAVRPLGARLARGDSPAAVGTPPPVTLDHFSAVGAWGEAREVARRVAALLDAGARPEGIAVVARRLDEHAAPLRAHFARLGLPLSGFTAKAPARPSARWGALVDLLADREGLATDRWLDLLGGFGEEALGPVQRSDLRLAFRALGAARLVHGARIVPSERLDAQGQLPLPVRRGLDLAEGRTGRGGAERRRLDGALLERAVDAAGRLVAWCQEWPERDSLGAYLRLLERLLGEVLGARAPGVAGWGRSIEEVDLALARLAELGLDDLELHTDEVTLLLSDALRELGRGPLGGGGGGVRILTVAEAAGRTFDHLFLLALNRGLFPPPGREDPLLPDGVRVLLTPALPDLPLGRDAGPLDRLAFARLLSAAPDVTLGWQSTDSDGKVRTVSPLVERLRRGVLPGPTVEASPGPEARSDALRPPAEQALAAALAGARGALRLYLPSVVEEARSALPYRASLPGPSSVSAARLAVLDEIDPDLSTDEGQRLRNLPGPWFGFVGPIRDPGDPRSRDPFVSLVEAVAACPWQGMLRRILRVEPVPDPLAAVPRVDPRLLGSLVHRILEHIVLARTGRAASIVDAARRPEPCDVAWPAPSALHAIAQREAAALLREEGISLPGLAEILARQVRPHLEVVQAADWADGAIDALGAELRGSVELGGRRLHFRVDRADRTSSGVRLTDYKIGRPFSRAGSAAARRSDHLDRVARGERLQAAAYAFADGIVGASGRFLFLKPDADEGTREAGADGDDFDFRTALEQVTGAVLAGLDRGVLFPRLAEPDGQHEPRRCRWCEVAEACVRGDSGARGRLVRWVGERSAAATFGDDGSPADRAFLDLWALPDRAFEPPRDDWEDQF
jgi:hypothetical protein